MKKTNKGFTIVELVVVIAVVAVLAAVLIPTFTSIIKKANDSAYLQERQSKQIEDLAEKIDNQNYLTWGDFEKELAEAMAKATKTGDELSAEIKAAVATAMSEYDDRSLKRSQVEEIINRALEDQLTTAQVEGIVNAAIAKAGAGASSITTAQVQAIVNAAIAQINTPVGVTAAQMQSAIQTAINSLISSEQLTSAIGEAVSAQLEAALAKFEAAQLTEDDVKEIIESVMHVSYEKIHDRGESIGASYAVIDDEGVFYSYDSIPNAIENSVTILFIEDQSTTFTIGVGSEAATIIYDLHGHNLTLNSGPGSTGQQTLIFTDTSDGETKGKLTTNDMGGVNGGSVIFKDIDVELSSFFGTNDIEFDCGECTFNTDKTKIEDCWDFFFFGTIIVRSGTFNVDPSNRLATGSTVTNNDNGTWTVTAN